MKQEYKHPLFSLFLAVFVASIFVNVCSNISRILTINVFYCAAMISIIILTKICVTYGVTSEFLNPFILHINYIHV